MNLLKNFVPKEFRPFLKHIGPTAFKVVDWKSALAQSGKVTQRFLSGKGSQELKLDLQSVLPNQMEFGTGSQKLTSNAEQKKQFGEDILQAYFAQLLNPTGCFLDFRQMTFSVEGDSLKWNPSNLWIQWNESFRNGLNQVYEGHYFEEPQKTMDGLVLMGLVNEQTEPATRDEIKNLLIDHVGSEDPTKMKFGLEKFENSFEQFFQILKTNKMKLPSDFLFLGVYLVLLYACLEGLDVSLNVQGAFMKSRGRESQIGGKA